jgi:DNA polymerase-4
VHTVTLEPDAVDIDKICGSVFSLVERLSRDLRHHQLECRRLRVTAIHTDYVEVSREADIDPGTCWETDLFNVGERLLKGALKRRVRVRRLIVEAKVQPLPHEQLTLFGEGPSLYPLPPRGERINVERGRRIAHALDQIRHRFGDTAVRWGRAPDYS